jgi:hypothetical protein
VAPWHHIFLKFLEHKWSGGHHGHLWTFLWTVPDILHFVHGLQKIEIHFIQLLCLQLDYNYYQNIMNAKTNTKKLVMYCGFCRIKKSANLFAFNKICLDCHNTIVNYIKCECCGKIKPNNEDDYNRDFEMCMDCYEDEDLRIEYENRREW